MHYYYFIRRQPAFFSDSTEFLNSHGLQGRKFGLRSSRRHSSPRSPPGLKENASSYLHNTKTPPASHTSPFCTRSKAPLLSCSHTHTQASKQTYIHIQPFINNTYTHLSLLLITKGRVGGFLRPWKTPHRVFDSTSCFRRLVQCTPYMYGGLFWRPQALPLVPHCTCEDVLPEKIRAKQMGAWFW